ncbi:MAG: hypothetical protein G01um10148_645 [Parcubacteria group bacterium Gr01-1014_8]|nr:MAG: hypothetical protein G01um10148_645 [Parcubacteria group bacterium Gr01-1014_8]
MEPRSTARSTEKKGIHPHSSRSVFHGGHSPGFSLVEMVVSVGLFAIVMLVGLGALVSLIDANRKARALESVMNNLNIALDGMVRAIRMGSTYHCGSGTQTIPQDCADTPGTSFAFEPFGGSSSDVNDQWRYRYDAETKRIYKSENGGGTEFPITAEEVSIEEMAFYVVGTTPGDTVQPKVVIVVKGIAGAAKVKTKTTYSIQATAAQRILDL